MSFLKKLCLCLAGGLPLTGSTQQLPHYSMYMANNFVLNPAAAGIERYTDLRLAARMQWTGVTDAPRTAYLTLHSALPTARPRPNVLSIGGKVFADFAGPIHYTQAEVNLAYRVKLSARYRLSFGLGAGVNHQQLDFSRMTFEEQGDPAVGTSDYGRTAPVATTGLWFYSDDLYLGIAAHNLLGSRGFWGNPSDGRGITLHRHYFATTAYRFHFPWIDVTPSVMVKYVKPAPVGIDVNLKGQLSDLLWAGVSWRQYEGMAAMAGVFVSSTLNFSYAYDFAGAGLRRYTAGSHEIVLGIHLNNERGPKCPTIVW